MTLGCVDGFKTRDWGVENMCNGDGTEIRWGFEIDRDEMRRALRSRCFRRLMAIERCE